MEKLHFNKNESLIIINNKPVVSVYINVIYLIYVGMANLFLIK